MDVYEVHVSHSFQKCPLHKLHCYVKQCYKKIGFDRCLNIVTSEKGCNCGQNVGCLRCSKIVTLGIMVSEMRQREVLLNDSVELVSHTLTAKNI